MKILGKELTFNGNKIYHAGSKPTASEIGAAASSHTHNYAGAASAGGAANSANILATARTINGTSFNGSSNITTANWGTARTLTIGNTGKSVNGSANISWSLAEIGAAASSHTHSYAPTSTGSSISIHADSDSSSTSEYLLLKAGHNELKIASSAGGTTVTKGQDKLTFNGNIVYHAGKKPTASEIGAAATSHGNHVPAVQTANARVFLRNDNTWQTLPSASTSATGIVQLNDAVNSTSTTQAATANAVKKAYDLANSAAKINDSATATSSTWSSSKTQTQINSSYNTMNSRVEALEETMYAEFVSKTGDTINGDLTIKKSDGSASKLKVYRTLSNNSMEGCLDVYAYDSGAVSLSTWNRTSNKQTSSYVFGGTSFFANANADGVRPDLGLQSAPFEKGWFNRLQVMSAMYTEGEVTLRGKTLLIDPILYNTTALSAYSSSGSKINICGVDGANNIFLGLNNQTYINVNNTMRNYHDIHVLNGKAVRITGQLAVNRTDSQAQMAIFSTAGDGNGIGDGNTHIGYYSGGYHHYFRGKGTTSINTHGGMTVTYGIKSLSAIDAYGEVNTRTGVTYSSSMHEKTNIVPVGGIATSFCSANENTNTSYDNIITNGLKNTKLHLYNYKNTAVVTEDCVEIQDTEIRNLKDADVFIGFLGQELEKENPDFFNLIGSSHTKEDGTVQYKIRESSVIGALWAGLQSAFKTIDELNEEVGKLKIQIQ